MCAPPPRWPATMTRRQRLRAEILVEPRSARNIAVGFGQIRDESLAYGIVDTRHDNGYRRGYLLRGLHARCGRGDDGIDLETYEIGGELRQPVGHAVGGAVFDHDVAPFRIAQLL